MSGEDAHLEQDYEDRFHLDMNDYDEPYYDEEETCDECGELFDDCVCDEDDDE